MFVSIETSALDGSVVRAHGTSLYPEVERILSSFTPRLRLEALGDLQRLGWSLLTTTTYPSDEGATIVLDTLGMEAVADEPDDELVSLRKLSTDVPSFNI